ncbi:hypothetical protein [Dactylosporangium sp. CA-139066]|uniref:hypothetical protein n=1 Tax=Dactylosporangium sp. CA-139066 TaxID=3239930 RepID=UPI003D8F61FA
MTGGGRGAPFADPRRTHALVVGVGRYASPHFEDRPALAHTADRFAGWLGGRGVPADNIVMLGGGAGDREATSANVGRAIAEDIPDRSGDLLWIFWAGHGVLDAERRRRLVLADATTRNAQTVDLGELIALYGSTFLAGFARQIVVVDACQLPLPPGVAARWPRPISLPPAWDLATGRTQRVWLAASAGEAAGYSGTYERAWFSDTVLDDLERQDELYWDPDYDDVRDALAAKLRRYVPDGDWEQHPVALRFADESGAARDEVLRPERRAEPGAAREVFSAADPVLEAYLRWFVATHETTGAQIAGAELGAPLRDAPWGGDLVDDGSNEHARRGELGDAATGPMSGEAEAWELTEQSLPSYLGASADADRLDLSGLTVHSAADLLRSTWRCVVLGDPGSGKTTLLRRLALAQAAASRFDDPLWRLPVLCTAADLVTRLGPDRPGAGRHALAMAAAEAGWSGVAPADPSSRDRLSAADLHRLVARAADADRLLLMIDGLDEVPTREQRTDLLARLNRMVDGEGGRHRLPAELPGNQLALSSRLVGYHRNDLTGHIHQLILRPMPEAAALATCDFWLGHYCAATGLGPRRAAELGAEVRAAVSGAGGIGQLASNPYLLLSLISAVASGGFAHRRLRGGSLLRSDLYLFMVDDALERAVRKRPGVRPDMLVALQTAVAYEIHRVSRRRVIRAADLEACARSAAAMLPPEVACAPDEGPEYVAAMGLISERAPHVFGFLHLTLQEYLAGRWLVADGAAAAGRIAGHLRDPRWAEPIRLGLGHLSRADPAGLEALLPALLAGPDGEYAARLLAAGLGELARVTAGPVELAVTASLAADARRLQSGRQRPGAAATVAPLLASAVTLPTGERPAQVAAAALAAALTSGSPWEMAAAAGTVETLRLSDRRVTEALFAAQYRDSTELGWSTLRALRAVVAADPGDPAAGTAGAATPGDEERADPGRVWADLLERDRVLLRRVTATAPPAAEAAPRLPLPPALTPFRNQLKPWLVARLEAAPPALVRLVIGLYDVVSFRDTQRLVTERSRLTAEAAMDDLPPPTRHAAAVRLDTVIVPALDQSDADPLLAPERIIVDSPLTARVMRWIVDETEPAGIAAELEALARDAGQDDDTRGDALAAWIALGVGGAARPVALAQVAGPGVRRRLAWRTDRTAFLLRDAAARVRLGPFVSAFEAAVRDEETDRQVVRAFGRRGEEFRRAARDALRRVTDDAYLGSGTGHLTVSLQEYLVDATRRTDSLRRYELAASLDIHGFAITRDGPLALAYAVATAHQAADPDGRSTGWRLDPNAPRAARPVPEMLTSLDGIAAEFTFLRCWVLDRTAGLLAADGFAVEAACVALAALPHDAESVTRTLGRLAAAMAQEDPAFDPATLSVGHPGLVARLAARVPRIADPYARARAELHLARLEGRALDPDAVLRLARDVDEADDRLRLLELAVTLAVADWSAPLLAAADAYAAAIADPRERDLAAARVAGHRDGGPVPAAGPRGAAHADLLAFEPLFAGASRELLFNWATLTCGHLVAEARSALQAEDAGALWGRLAEPAGAEAAAGALRRLGREQRLVLDAGASAAVDALLRRDRPDLAAEMLAVGTAPPAAAARRWRRNPDRRVADLAALLVVEGGRLDAAAAEALPRLLADRDELVRLRTSAALIDSGTPRFTDTGLGAETLAALVRVADRCRRTAPAVATDLRWALHDIVHDSILVLGRVLADLGDADLQRSFLRSIVRVTPVTLAHLAGLLPSLSEANQLALLYTLQGTAVRPLRAGVDRAAVERVAVAVRDARENVSDRVLEELLYLIGAAGAPEAANLRPLAAAVAAAADGRPTPGAVGACHGLGFLLARSFAGVDAPAAAAAREDLRRLARGPATDEAEAAVSALSRLDERAWLREAVAAGDVDPLTMFWGLVGGLDAFRWSDDERRQVADLCRFVLAPPAGSPADAAALTRSLVRALVAGASELLAVPIEERRRASAATAMARDSGNMLTVLAELARLRPAPVRRLIDSAFPALRGQLVAEFADGDWMARQAVARLLVVLGRADGAAVAAILDTAVGTTIVRQGLFADLAWFNKLRPDGLAALLAAVDDPLIQRCYLAFQVLAYLVEREALSAADHARALVAVQRVLARPDLEQPMYLEESGEVRPTGTYADACRQRLGVLGGLRPPPGAEPSARCVLVEAPDAAGRPMRLHLPLHGRRAFDQLDFQLAYYGQVERREPDRPLIDALIRAQNAAWEAGLTLPQLLAHAAAG